MLHDLLCMLLISNALRILARHRVNQAAVNTWEALLP
jgi:hypothetical protein